MILTENQEDSDEGWQIFGMLDLWNLIVNLEAGCVPMLICGESSVCQPYIDELVEMHAMHSTEDVLLLEPKHHLREYHDDGDYLLENERVRHMLLEWIDMLA